MNKDLEYLWIIDWKEGLGLFLRGVHLFGNLITDV
jgi:hypothetical protein